MEEIGIKKIHFRFKHANKFYIIFDINNSDDTYLYFFNPKNDNRSLLYGKDLHLLIEKYLTNPKIKCLECALGINLYGAVSYDEGEVIESNLTIVKANKILNKLNERINREKIIRLF